LEEELRLQIEQQLQEEQRREVERQIEQKLQSSVPKKNRGSSPVKKNYVELNKEQAFQTRNNSPMRKLQTNVSKHSLLRSTESKITPVKSKSIPSARIPKRKDLPEQSKEVARVSVDLNTSPNEEPQLEVFTETKQLRPPSKTPNNKS
jgi:hypothetical protein